MFQVRTSARTRLNFIPGTNVTINVDDDAGQDRANVTISASVSGSDPGPAFDQANTARGHANAAFAQANNVTAAFNQANNVTAAFLQANTAGSTAISAFLQANVANTLSVGNTLSNNMFQLRTTGRTRLNFIPGTSITINVDDDSGQDRANVTITAPDVVAAFNQANNVTAAFLKANTAGTDATNAFGQANNVTAAFLKANTAGTDATNAFNRANAEVAIVYVIDGGGSVITTGVKGDLSIPFACTITGVRTLLDISGNLVVDIWKTTYANYPPVVANTITASADPTVTQNTKSEDTTLTGWTKTIAAGDVIRFNVDSVANATRATITLKAVKTA